MHYSSRDMAMRSIMDADDSKTKFLQIVRKVFEPHSSRKHKAMYDYVVSGLDGKGILGPVDFYGYVNSTKFEEDLWTLCQEIEGIRDDKLAWSRLKAVWRMCQEIVATPKVAKGGDNQKEEDPLDDDDRKQIDDAWNSRYDFIISKYLTPADTIQAKVFRQIRKGTSTLIRINTVQSIYMCYKPENEERIPLGQGFEVRRKENGEVRLRNVVDYYEGLRILGYAYAKAGNFRVKGQEGTSVTYSPLDVNLDYADKALRTAHLTGKPPHLMLQWLTDVDHLTRGTMVHLMRQGWAQGEALTQSLKEHAVEWKIGQSRTPQETMQEYKEYKGKGKGGQGWKRDQWGNGKGSGGKGDKGRNKERFRDRSRSRRGDRTGKNQDAGRKVKTGTHFQGKKVCKLWHANQCTNSPTCPKGDAHVCDVIRKDGKVCGLNHKRANHRTDRE